jgi:hypothetical protein
MIKTILKVGLALFLVWLFIVPRVTAFNDSYEEKFCKSYGQWNKYAWSVDNQNSENWESLKLGEYRTLMGIVENDSPSSDNYLTKIATQWFTDSAVGDYASGTTMAAILVVECEKNGVKIDEKYLRK